jgi:hypothetical protein
MWPWAKIEHSAREEISQLKATLAEMESQLADANARVAISDARALACESRAKFLTGFTAVRLNDGSNRGTPRVMGVSER